MSDSTKRQDALNAKTQSYFNKGAKAEQGEMLWKQLRKKEQSASKANTAKLRELRLAKEEADRQEAAKLPAKPAKAKKAAAKPKKKPIVMRY